MDNSTLSSLRAWAFKYRGGIWTALFVVILALARPVPSRLPAGIALVVVGQLLRGWGVGCIKRYRGEEVKADELATWGPYALVRNPLYVGNGLVGLGWGWISGNAATVVFLVAFWVLYGLLIVPHEEAFLRGKYGDEFEEWASRVPAFLPKWSLYEGGMLQFSWKTFIRREYATIMSAIFTYTVLDYILYYLIDVRNAGKGACDSLNWLRHSLYLLIAYTIIALLIKLIKHKTKWLDATPDRD